MSMAALLIGVADWLTGDNGKIRLDEENCRILDDGSPDEDAGDMFVSIHPAEWSQTNDAGTALDENFGFQITISMRARGIPRHNWGKELLCKPRDGTSEGGLYAVAESIRAALHCQYTPTLTNANSLIDLAADAQQTTANGFDPEPIFFAGAGTPTKRMPSWWGAVESPPDAGDPYAGVSITLNFRPVRRVQDIASQT